MKKIIFWLVITALVCGLAIGCAPTPEPAPTPTPTPTPKPTPTPTPKPEPIELKAVTSFPYQTGWTFANFRDFVEIINEKAKGELTITIIGGPEAIPSMEQIEALKSGVIDINATMGSYYASIMPSSNALPLSDLTPWEEREVGAYDLWVKIHKEQTNAMYLGKYAPNEFSIWTTERIDNPRTDFQGLKIRGVPMYKPFLDALGASLVSIPFPEVYSAMERGVVDGYCMPAETVDDAGWAAVSKYHVGPGWYKMNNRVELVNLDTWNQLPEHLQKLLLDTEIEMERKWYPLMEDYYSVVHEKLESEGVEFIEFSPDDEQWFLDTVSTESWKWVLEQATEYGPQLKALLTK
ncbi:TRAP transporter substrate-binding protein DctP [Chloroflexota bacterium]